MADVPNPNGWDLKPGDKATLSYVRDGRRETTQVTLARCDHRGVASRAALGGVDGQQLGEHTTQTFGSWEVDWIEPQRVQETDDVRILVLSKRMD